jgi:hypothetical protein
MWMVSKDTIWALSVFTSVAPRLTVQREPQHSHTMPSNGQETIPALTVYHGRIAQRAPAGMRVWGVWDCRRPRRSQLLNTAAPDADQLLNTAISERNIQRGPLLERKLNAQCWCNQDLASVYLPATIMW